MMMFVCVLFTQGALPLKKVLTFTEEDACQQSSLYVHPLQHFHHKKLSHPTVKDTTENSCILVANAGNVFHLTIPYISI